MSGVKATVCLTIEINADAHWSDRATIAEIKKRAIREVNNKIHNFIKTYPGSIKVIGKPEYMTLTHTGDLNESN